MRIPSVIILNRLVHAYDTAHLTYCGLGFSREELMQSNDAPDPQAVPCRTCEHAVEREALNAAPAVGTMANTMDDAKSFAVSQAVILVKNSGMTFEECFQQIWSKLT